MAQLDNVVTNATTGEAINYDGYDDKVQFKQEFQVTKNSNYTWTVRSTLYGKLISGSGTRFFGFWQGIGNNNYNTGVEDVQFLSTGIYINRNKVSNNSYEYYKLLENTININCTSTGRNAIRLRCGKLSDDGTSNYYFNEYRFIYLTLPAFSGMKYKINSSWKSSMPWIKVNGEWKRVKQFIKVNNTWKEYNSTWIWNPEA